MEDLYLPISPWLRQALVSIGFIFTHVVGRRVTVTTMAADSILGGGAMARSWSSYLAVMCNKPSTFFQIPFHGFNLDFMAVGAVGVVTAILVLGSKHMAIVNGGQTSLNARQAHPISAVQAGLTMKTMSSQSLPIYGCIQPPSFQYFPILSPTWQGFPRDFSYLGHVSYRYHFQTSRMSSEECALDSPLSNRRAAPASSVPKLEQPELL